MTRRYWWWRVVATLVLTVTSGCSSSSGTHEERVSEDELNQMREALNEPPEERAGREADYTAQRDAFLVDCMAELGFEFVPLPEVRTPQQHLGLSDEQFVRQYGFGISTLIDFRPDVDVPVDPNVAIREGLSPSAQDAYDIAMSDCNDDAIRTLGVGPGWVAHASDSKVIEALIEASEEARSDPRVVKAREEYQSCMAAEGFRAQNGEALRGDVLARVAPFAEAYEQALTAHVEAGREVALTIDDVLNESEMEELQSIQQFELRAAGADFECGADFYRIVGEVNREYGENALDRLDDE